MQNGKHRSSVIGLIMLLFVYKVFNGKNMLIQQKYVKPAEDNGIEVKNRIIGLGKCTTRLPTEREREILLNAGYEPPQIICFNKMKLNEIRYDCKNNNNFKFCNSNIFYNGMFGIIIAIINFVHNDEIVGGILIQRLREIEYAFNTQHIYEVVVSHDMYFIKKSALVKPAVQIFGSNKMYTIKQANCWETD